MPWVSQRKRLEVTSVVAHHCAKHGVTGRAPAVSSFDFTPAELYGAAASCSFMHVVDPGLVSPEAQMMQALIENHVDDVSPDFAIISTANAFKDFVKSFFVGTVSAGLARLTMEANGYFWRDHFENMIGGNASVRKSPDFFFAGTGSGVALVESKGTRSRGRKVFDSTVEEGYLEQVEPHLGHPISNIVATHGYCIGSWLTSANKAEVIIHHTSPVGSSPGSAHHLDSQSTVQLHSYATTFAMVQASELGIQLRGGIVEDVPEFLKFSWLDRSWLTRSLVSAPLTWLFEGLREDEFFLVGSEFFPRFRMFAIEETIASRVLRYFSRREEVLEIEPLGRETIVAARQNYEEDAAAVFPDGLAVIGWGNPLEDLQTVRWNGQSFEPAILP